MHTAPAPTTPVRGAISARHALLEELIALVLREFNAGFGGFALALAGALVDAAEMDGDIRAVQMRIRAGNLLRSRQFAFLHLAATALEKSLRAELAQLGPRPALQPDLGALALVPYEVMDEQVTLAAVSKPFDAQNADALAALNLRLAAMLERGTLRSGKHPFRPELFVAALQQAWCQFNEEQEAAGLLVAMLKPGLMLDLAPLYAALNLHLERKGIHATPAGRARPRQDAAQERLRKLFGERPGAAQNALPAAGGMGAAGRERLMDYLAWLQREAPRSNQAEAAPHNVVYLPTIKQGAPRGALSEADEHAIDLLTAVFEAVFRDQHIAREVRELVLLLQVPVLKAALADKDFFFHDAHPARRLIELLSRMGWEQRRGSEDPLYEAMQRSVERIGRDPQQEASVFSEAVDELEGIIEREEQAAEQAMAQPIAAALKQERHTVAQRQARETVAVRLGSGEVVAVVEAFLANQWTEVLTLAYTVDERKPGAVRHATAAMDELIWSVKPKISAQERRELIAKLPGLLQRLNQWLDAIRWQDAERLRFFAELAECHASIVRAPVDLSPERRLELSLQAAQQAAERRAAMKERQMETKEDTAPGETAGLKRGMWLQFDQDGAAPRTVKLAWVSPLRTLFIFSTRAREEAFTLSGEELARRFAQGRVRVTGADGVVDRALAQALADNDAISPSAASSM